MFHFGTDRRPRRPSLTPMIDVVFLLLVFFMLAAQFGHDKALALTLGAAGAPYVGAPRLLDIAPDTLALNGGAVTIEALADRMAPLTRTPEDIIVLRPTQGADLQRVIDVAQTLTRAGFTQLAMVE